MTTATVDWQAEQDREVWQEFRRRVHTGAARVRVLQKEEAAAKTAAKEIRKARKEVLIDLQEHIEADEDTSVTDLDFASKVRQLTDSVREKQDEERQRRQEWQLCVTKRKTAQLELQRLIETYTAPLPLFDRRAGHQPADQPRTAPVNGEEQKPSSPPVPACRICGCTERCACAGGCSWVEPDLCSGCVGASDLAVVEAMEGKAALRLILFPDGRLAGFAPVLDFGNWWRDKLPEEVQYYPDFAQIKTAVAKAAGHEVSVLRWFTNPQSGVLRIDFKNEGPAAKPKKRKKGPEKAEEPAETPTKPYEPPAPGALPLNADSGSVDSLPIAQLMKKMLHDTGLHTIADIERLEAPGYTLAERITQHTEYLAPHEAKFICQDIRDRQQTASTAPSAGPTSEQLHAAYVAASFGGATLEKPALVRPLELDGKLWVGTCGDNDSWTLLPLYPFEDGARHGRPESFAEHYRLEVNREPYRALPGTHERGFYYGVLVRVGRKKSATHVIGADSEQRVVARPKGQG